jgi:hypothetical protein
MRCRGVAGFDINEFYALEIGNVKGQTVKKEHIDLPGGYVVPETKNSPPTEGWSILVSILTIIAISGLFMININNRMDVMVTVCLIYFGVSLISIFFLLIVITKDNGGVQNQLSYFYDTYMIGINQFGGYRSLWIISVLLLVLVFVCATKCLILVSDLRKEDKEQNLEVELDDATMCL